MSKALPSGGASAFTLPVIRLGANYPPSVAANHERMRDFPDLFTKLKGEAQISESSLRDCVLAGLQELFNTRSGLCLADLTEFPHVATSILNYGVRDPSGPVGGQGDYAKHLLWAIRTFEPRIYPDTISVNPASIEEDMPQTGWLFQIDGLLPYKNSFRCFAFFDLIDGRAVIY